MPSDSQTNRGADSAAENSPYAPPFDDPASGSTRFAQLPLLYRDRAFWGITSTQLLGAFNDNLFKQLMLLMALRVAHTQSSWDLQPVAMVVFSLPFVLFSGYAGFLSDRYSKRTVIVLAKVAEIAVMLLGMVAFAAYGTWGFPGLLVVLWLMGMQSSFFGPGKYGILPEMFRESDLPRANGVVLMTTFVAIIFGTASAGFLTDLFLGVGSSLPLSAGDMWMACGVCVAIAVAGTLTSLLIRRVPAAVPGLSFRPSALTVPPESRRMLRGDRTLFVALLASCMFWLVAGIAQQSVNSLGKAEFKLSDTRTSLMAAMIGIGIGAGAVLAGRLSHGRVNFRVMRVGAWGIVVCLLALALPGPNHGHLWGYRGSLAMLTLLGVAAGFFAIPLQVVLQSRPPEGLKGRMIALMNQANFLAILLSGPIYGLMDRIVDGLDWPRHAIFAFTGILMLPVAIFYRPRA